MENKKMRTSSDADDSLLQPKRPRFWVRIFFVFCFLIVALPLSLSIPNQLRAYQKSKSIVVFGEIPSIELALSKILLDVPCETLRELFNTEGVNAAVGRPDSEAAWTAEEFRKAQELYTATFYALLREGRLALEESYETSFGRGRFGDVLNHDVVKKLSTSYLDLEFDPWGNMYQIFPGPWDGAFEGHPIIFRTYRVPEANPINRKPLERDGFSFEAEDPDTNKKNTISYPAPRDKVVYIYSLGANKVSGQMMYRPDYEGVTPRELYEEQKPEYRGGVDDISNWDRNWNWQPFH
jgi:hypothetical protein